MPEQTVSEKPKIIPVENPKVSIASESKPPAMDASEKRAVISFKNMLDTNVTPNIALGKIANDNYKEEYGVMSRRRPLSCCGGIPRKTFMVAICCCMRPVWVVVNPAPQFFDCPIRVSVCE